MCVLRAGCCSRGPSQLPLQGRRLQKLLSLLAMHLSPMCSLCLLSRVRLSATPWTIARQAPLSIGFPRQESCSGLSFLPPGDLPDPGIKPASPALAGMFFTTSATWEAQRLQRREENHGSTPSKAQAWLTSPSVAKSCPDCWIG